MRGILTDHPVPQVVNVVQYFLRKRSFTEKPKLFAIISINIGSNYRFGSPHILRSLIFVNAPVALMTPVV